MAKHGKFGSGSSNGNTSVEYEMKRSRATGIRDVVICAFIILGFLFYRESTDTREIGPVLGETQFSVVAMDGEQHTFVYAETESIELLDNLDEFDRGTMIGGNESKRCVSGTFQNEQFGEYELHVLTKLDSYIVVNSSNGVLVFNIESDETTAALYDFFCERIDVK